MADPCIDEQDIERYFRLHPEARRRLLGRQSGWTIPYRFLGGAAGLTVLLTALVTIYSEQSLRLSYRNVPIELLAEDQYWSQMQYCVSNFHSERDRGIPRLASAISSLENETAFKVHFAGRGGPLSSGSNAPT